MTISGVLFIYGSWYDVNVLVVAASGNLQAVNNESNCTELKMKSLKGHNRQT